MADVLMLEMATACEAKLYRLLHIHKILARLITICQYSQVFLCQHSMMILLTLKPALLLSLPFPLQ